MIRAAKLEDAPRIAEILIFAKRVAYRPIFQNDRVSFNEMQVVPLFGELRAPEALNGYYVYDDGILKAVMRMGPSEEAGYADYLQLHTLYVDPFFQREGIGGEMLQWLLNEVGAAKRPGAVLWVLEKNQGARSFYEAFGFYPDGVNRLEAGTTEYLLRYVKQAV